MEGPRHLSILRNDVPVIVGKSQEAAHISHSDEFWPVHYCSCLLGICFYTITGDYMIQIGDFGLKNSHLLGLSLSYTVANFANTACIPWMCSFGVLEK